MWSPCGRSGSAVLLAAFVLMVTALPGDARKNLSVINPEVDAALKQGPPWFYDVLACVGIAMGAVFAFFGLKTVRLQSTFYGAVLAGGAAAFVLYLIPGQEEASVWLGVVISSAIIFGYIIGRIVILRKFTLFLVFGATIAGVFNQYALSYFIGLPEWLIWSTLGLSLVLAAFLIWRYYHISAIVATAFIGGFLVLLGSARLLRGEISLIGMWVDPEFMQGCVTLECWIPFFAGAGTFTCGSLFQICMRRRQKRLKKVADQAGINERDDEAGIDPTSSPRKDPYNGNPFAPEPTGHNADPLIVELSETLEARKNRRRNDEIGLA